MVSIDKNIVNLIRYLTIKEKISQINREYSNTYNFDHDGKYVYHRNKFMFNYRDTENLNSFYPGIFKLIKGLSCKVAELSKNY